MQTNMLEDRAAPAEPEPLDTFGDVTSDELPRSLDADFAPFPKIENEPPPHSDDVDPFQQDSMRAQEAFNEAVEAGESGDEQRAIQAYIRAAKIAETAREWQMAAVACQRVGNWLVACPPPYDLERGFRMYRRAIHAYEECGLFAEARDLAYRQMCIKLRHAGELKLPALQRVELFLNWAVSGFGYRPLRVVGTAAVVVLTYAFVYWLGAGVTPPPGEGAPGFWQTLYFSGITFSTLGYGDFVPDPHMRLVAMSEGFLGALTIGLFAAVLAHRLSRA